MKKGFLMVLIALFATASFAQEEIAMYTLVEEGFSPAGIIPARRDVRLLTPARSNSHRSTPLDLVMEQEPFPGFPKKSPEYLKAAFGEQFVVWPDSLSSSAILNLDKKYGELMIFARDSEGKMVLAQLVRDVERVEFELKGAPGQYEVEVLSQEGDKATFLLNKE